MGEQAVKAILEIDGVTAVVDYSTPGRDDVGVGITVATALRMQQDQTIRCEHEWARMVLSVLDDNVGMFDDETPEQERDLLFALWRAAADLRNYYDAIFAEYDKERDEGEA